MDEDKDEQPPFQWNRQVTFMVCLSMLAMALPLAGVAYFAQGYLLARQRMAASPPTTVATVATAPEKPVVVDTASLEKNLERVSDARFASVVTLKDEDAALDLAVAPADMDARIARIGELARDAGGSALDVGDAGAKTRRVMVQVAASRLDLLKRAIRGERVDFSAIPAGTETKTLEVELRAP